MPQGVSVYVVGGRRKNPKALILRTTTTLTTNVKLIFKEVNRTAEEEKWCKI